MERIANRWKFVDPEPEVKGVLLSDGSNHMLRITISSSIEQISKRAI